MRGQRTHVGLHDFPHARIGRVLCDLRWRYLFLAERFAQAFERNTDADCASISEQIRDGLGDTEDRNLYALDDVVLNTRTQMHASKAHKADRRILEPWQPFLRPDRNPDLRRHLVDKLVKSQR